MSQLDLRVRAISRETNDVRSFELVHPDGASLPPFEAGAHIDVAVPPRYLRQYSLCNDPDERHRYLVAVLREHEGSGGSRNLHDLVRVGDTLRASTPRNHFPLVETASRHILIAGGIGITPILAMAYRLRTIDADFILHYCARSPATAAFTEVLSGFDPERIVYHHDGGEPSRGLDVARLLSNHQPGEHLYCCGPAGLMSAVHAATSHWAAGHAHFELFAPPAPIASASAAQATPDESFRVRLQRRDRTLTVPQDRSIVEVLRENGVEVQTSCEAGTCGTCRTRYLAGDPDHRDFVLTEDEQEQFVMICCARAFSPLLVLDL